jgi:hypothetical protein
VVAHNRFHPNTIYHYVDHNDFPNRHLENGKGYDRVGHLLPSTGHVGLATLLTKRYGYGYYDGVANPTYVPMEESKFLTNDDSNLIAVYELDYPDYEPPEDAITSSNGSSGASVRRDQLYAPSSAQMGRTMHLEAVTLLASLPFLLS